METGHTMGIRTVVLKDELGIITFTLEQMGFDVAGLYETDRKTAEICRHNLKSGCIQRELLECGEEDIPDMEFLAAQLPGSIFAVPLRKQETDINRWRLQKYLEIINRKRPKVFLFETYSRALKTEMFSAVLSELRRMGYQCIYQLCDIGESTGLPVSEKRVYLIGISPEKAAAFHFPEKPAARVHKRPEDICCAGDAVDPWYLKLSEDRVDFFEDQQAHFYCWREKCYVPKERVDWNLVKLPLIYDGRVLRKITHREMARLKGLPDKFYLDTSNKAWLYQKLAYGSNAVFIRRMAEAVRRLLDGDGVRDQQRVNAYRFQNLLEKYFRYKNIRFADGKAYSAEPDFVLIQKDKQILIEAKWYNSNTGIDSRIFQVCERIQDRKEVRPENYILITGNLVRNSSKQMCQEKYGIAVWDVKNLLWLFEEFPDIKSEFVSMLNYTLGDIVPEKPDLKFEGEWLRKEKEEEGQERKETGEPEEAQEAGGQYISGEKEEPQVNFREQLAEIPPGKEDLAPYKYEKTGTAILKYVFGDYLTLWEEQKHSNDELYRFDLCCKIKHGKQPEFFDTIKEFFRTKYIVFEFKNYTKAVTQEEIYTTEKYLYQKALRGVAIVVSRKGADKNALRAARGCLRENGKLILCLSDEDLLELLRIKEEGERETADYLSDMLDGMLLHLEK